MSLVTFSSPSAIIYAFELVTARVAPYFIFPKPSADDVNIVVRNALGNYGFILDVLPVLGLLLPCLLMAVGRALSVVFTLWDVLYPLSIRHVFPFVELVLFSSLCTICEICVYLYLTFVIVGEEAAALIVTSLRIIACSSAYSHSSSVMVLESERHNTVDTAPIQPTRAESMPCSATTSIEQSMPMRTFTTAELAWEKAVLEAWFAALLSSDAQKNFRRSMKKLKADRAAGRL